MNEGDSTALLHQISATLQELLVWTRATSFPRIQEMLQREFGGEDDQAALKARVYSLTNGESSTRDISRAIGGALKHVAVATLHGKWRSMGLAAPVNPGSERSPTKALFDLRDFGIEVPTRSPNPGRA